MVFFSLVYGTRAAEQRAKARARLKKPINIRNLSRAAWQVHGRADHCGFAEHEGGAKTAELARKHWISEATLYNWKSKYGGLDVSEVKRLRMLEDENRKLKKLLAESMLDNAALKELLAKKW